MSWDRSTQKIVTLSTGDAEYVALGDEVKEGLLVKAVTYFIAPGLPEKFFKVFVDNEPAIDLATNSVLPGPSILMRVSTSFGSWVGRVQFQSRTFRRRNNVQIISRKRSRVPHSGTTEPFLVNLHVRIRFFCLMCDSSFEIIILVRKYVFCLFSVKH